MAKRKQKDKAQPDGFTPEFPGHHHDEKVELVFRQHPAVMRRPLIYGMLAILLGIVPLMIWPLSNTATQIALGVPVLVILYWFYHWIGWYYSVYILTDQRLIDIQQHGLFNRRVNEVALERIQSVNYHVKGLQAAMFKFGDITVQTYVGDWVMEMIYEPVEVHSYVMTAVRESSHGRSTDPFN